MEALSFYEYKNFLGRPNPFGRVPIILDGSNLFWLGPNHFGQVQTRLLWTNLYILLLVVKQNDGQNNFGPIEGQGIILNLK